MLKVVLPALVLVASQLACVLLAADGHDLDGPYDTFDIQGFFLEPLEPIIIEAFNQKTDNWEIIGVATTEPPVAIKAGTWKNSPDLYHWIARDVSIASTADPNSLCRWNRECRADYEGRARLRVRLSGGGGGLGGMDSAGWDCFHKQPHSDSLRTIVERCGGYRSEFSIRIRR